MYSVVSYCPHCGAPIYTYSGSWCSILPPPIQYSCNCRFTLGLKPPIGVLPNTAPQPAPWPVKGKCPNEGHPCYCTGACMGKPDVSGIWNSVKPNDSECGEQFISDPIVGLKAYKKFGLFAERVGTLFHSDSEITKYKIVFDDGSSVGVNSGDFTLV